MKRIFTLALVTLFFVIGSCRFSFAQDVNDLPEWRKMKYLSEEEMSRSLMTRSFVETPPPTGEVRFPAEYEPMQAVMIVYPLGIPVELVREMAEDCKVITVVTSYEQQYAQSEFQSAGVNMDNIEFLNATTDSYWIRDFGPWYIFNGKEPAIVDNIYNRPRPNDDNLPSHFADYWGIEMFGMKVVHTGGNMMQDGRGNGVSDDIVITESVAEGITETQVYDRMRDYLGIDPYHVTIDPQGDYIAHVDCWGKYLAPDKIVLARVPESNPRYPYYEEVADYFKATNCCWGYPYKVYRIDIPGGDIVSPYTNSLILNKKVLVPMGSNSQYNESALEVYREAMPGYEVIGIQNNSYWDGWLNTDALHCRTRGVMDFNMLHIDHRDVLFGKQEWQDSLAITSKVIAYSGADLKQDSLLIYYSIDGSEYKTATMTATGNADEYVGYIKGYQENSEVDYYVFAADESGRRAQQPIFGQDDPHNFTVGAYGEKLTLTLNPEEIVFDFYYDYETPETLTITNNTDFDVVIESITIKDDESYDIDYEFTLPYTIAVGESVEVDVYLMMIICKAVQFETELVITSSVGEQTVVVKYDDEVSVEENDVVSVEIFPNPMNEVLHIIGDAVENVTIFNSVGQQVIYVENRNDVDVSLLSEGLYFVRVVDNKGNTAIKKVIK